MTAAPNQQGWYAVHTNSQKEGLADRMLRAQGIYTFYPFSRHTVRHARQVSEVERPYFNRYLFAQLRWDQTVSAINRTIGVSTVVYMCGEPLKIPDEVITELMDRCDTEIDQRTGDERYAVPQSPEPAHKEILFHKGQKVRFKDNNAFFGMVAEVKRVDSSHKITLWLSNLGKGQNITAPAEFLELAS